MASMLGAAVLVTLALGAASAQAHEWHIEGTPLAKLGGEAEIAGESESGPIEFNWDVLEGELNWTCEEEKESGTIEAGGVGHATIEFRNCAFVHNLGRCYLNPTMEVTVNLGAVEVETGGETKTYVAYTTPKGEAMEVFVEGAECALAPQTWSFAGTFASEFAPEEERVLQPRVFSEAEQIEGGFRFGPAAGPLVIDGEWSEHLVGPYEGELWSLS